MDVFDEAVLAVPKDGGGRSFNQILEEVDFSRNTLRLHLDLLLERGAVLREKKPSKGPGRPIYLYSMNPKSSCRSSQRLAEP